MANHPAAMGVKMDFDEWFLREFGHLPGTCRQMRLMRDAFEAGRIHRSGWPQEPSPAMFSVWLGKVFRPQAPPVPYQSMYFLAITAGYEIGAFR